MKTSIKLLILAGVIFVLVSVLFAFFRSVSAPPTISSNDNPFDVDMAKDIKKVKDIQSTATLDSLFDTFRAETVLWYQNSLISSAQADGNLGKFIDAFVPAYVSMNKNNLKTKSWGDDERIYIEGRISKMKSFHFLGASVIEGRPAMMPLLDGLSAICNAYSKVKGIVAHTNYVDMSTSRSRIERIDAFKNNEYLAQSDLSGKMASYKSDLGDAHYDYIKSQYQELTNWEDYSLPYIESIGKRFRDAYSSYTSTNIYGSNHPKDLSDLNSKASALLKEARDEKCYLRVYGKDYDFTLPSMAGGESKFMSVDTNHPDGFTVSNIPGFCDIDENSSSINVSVSSSNPKGNSGTFTVRAGNKSIDVTVIKEAAEGSVTFNSINQRHDVYRGNTKGMEIIVNFDAYNLEGTPLDVAVWFYFSSGEKLKDFNGKFRTSSGQVATSVRVTPTCDGEMQARIFMPLDELHMANGRHELKFSVGIFNGDKHLRTTSSYYDFVFNK